MGGGALATISRSITDVRVEFGQADFPLPTPKIHRRILKATISTFISDKKPFVLSEPAVLVGRDDHVAFGLAVVAHALHAVDLGQLVDDFPVFSVHGREAVAPLRLFTLQTSVICGVCIRKLIMRSISCSTRPISLSSGDVGTLDN